MLRSTLKQLILRQDRFAITTTLHVGFELINADPDDNPILECPQASRSDYLVTGEEHLLLKPYAGTLILKPAEFLELLERSAIGGSDRIG
jgi:predicted nucleic acid-binding protein